MCLPFPVKKKTSCQDVVMGSGGKIPCLLYLGITSHRWMVGTHYCILEDQGSTTGS